MMRASLRAARAATCIALASALCVPAFAAQFDYYLKLPPIEGDSGEAAAGDDKHKGEIEILSWSWGATQSGSAHTGGGMGAGKANVQDISMAATGTDAPAADGTAAKLPGKRTPPTVTLKRGTSAAAEETAAKEAKAGPAPISHDLRTNVVARTAAAGGVSVAAGDVDGDGAEAAERKSGSLVYLSRSRQKEMLMPASRGAGSLSLDVPAGMCRAGARYPTAEFGTPQGRHTLENVLVTSCTALASSDRGRPMETIALNYEKIR